MPARTSRGGVVINAAANTTLTSTPPMNISNYWLLSLHAYSAANTRAGAITAEVSNDGDNWVGVTFDSGATSLSVDAGTLCNKFANLSNLGGIWFRVKYTDATGGAGLGTLKVIVHLKGQVK